MNTAEVVTLIIASALVLMVFAESWSKRSKHVTTVNVSPEDSSLREQLGAANDMLARIREAVRDHRVANADRLDAVERILLDDGLSPQALRSQPWDKKA